MGLKIVESGLKKKCIKIIKNNSIEEAVRKISNLKFEDKKLGIQTAKNICKLYAYGSVSSLDKPDSFNRDKEVHKKLVYLSK